mmetsp:Transcript_25053/g.41568  ORF Transcript_25053/g.41568 Transcript_25053/m.41568 type:complete len:84 (+) Transcript_25053:304-555(+)
MFLLLACFLFSSYTAWYEACIDWFLKGEYKHDSILELKNYSSCFVLCKSIDLSSIRSCVDLSLVVIPCWALVAGQHFSCRFIM